MSHIYFSDDNFEHFLYNCLLYEGWELMLVDRKFIRMFTTLRMELINVIYNGHTYNVHVKIVFIFIGGGFPDLNVYVI